VFKDKAIEVTLSLPETATEAGFRESTQALLTTKAPESLLVAHTKEGSETNDGFKTFFRLSNFCFAVNAFWNHEMA